MRKATVGATVTLAAIAGVWNLTAVSVLGQAKLDRAAARRHAFGGEAPKTRYVTPRTPWGDPDLQGVWSTDDTSGIPMARPAPFGDRLYLNPEEFTARAKQVERGITQGDQEAVGPFRFDFARRAFHQTSLIVDPPTAGCRPSRPRAHSGRCRAAPMAMARSTGRPISPSTSGASRAGSSDPRCASSTATAPRFRRARASSRSRRDDPRHAHHPDRRPASPEPRDRTVSGRRQGPWDGDELVVETTNFTDRTAIGLNGNGNRTSTKLKLTERFKRRRTTSCSIR